MAVRAPQRASPGLRNDCTLGPDAVGTWRLRRGSSDGYLPSIGAMIYRLERRGAAQGRVWCVHSVDCEWQWDHRPDTVAHPGSLLFGPMAL